MLKFFSYLILILSPGLSWGCLLNSTAYPEILEELRVRGTRLVRFPGSTPFPSWGIHEVGGKEGVERILVSRISNVGRPYHGNIALWMGFNRSSISGAGSLVSRVRNGGVQVGAEVVPDGRICAFIGLRSKGNSLFLGRESICWGHGGHSLLLSGKAKASDFFLCSFECSNFKLSWCFTQLDGLHRCLTAHRLEVLLGSRFILGLSEAYLFDFSGLREMSCLNPLPLYYSQQWNSRKNGNILWSLDGCLELSGISVAGELLIDDFQYCQPEDKEPNHLGLRLWMGISDPFGLRNTYWKFQYTRLSRWTYAHFESWQRYEHRGDPIGHPYGPDFDDLGLKVVYHHGSMLDFNLGVNYIRHGEGRIDSAWPQGEFPSNNFLSGEVERKVELSSGMSFYGKSLNLTGTAVYSFTYEGGENVVSRKTLRGRIGIGKLFG